MSTIKQPIDQKPIENKSPSNIMGWIIFVLVLISVFFFFRFVISFTIVSGDSMNPTLEDNNIVLSSNIFYTIERNDIIIVEDSNGYRMIKRVVGLPNETVAIDEGVVYVNGAPLGEEYIVGEPVDMDEVVVQNGYFVIGDNRNPGASLDSRSSEIGSITEEHIHGKVLFRLFPFLWFG